MSVMEDFRGYGHDIAGRDPIRMVQQRLLEVMRTHPQDFSPRVAARSRGYGLDGVVGPTMREALIAAIQRGHLPAAYGNVVVGTDARSQQHNRQLFAAALAHERTRGAEPFTGPVVEPTAHAGPLSPHAQAVADFQNFARAMGRNVTDPPGHIGPSTMAAYAGTRGQQPLGDRGLYNRFATQMQAEMAAGRLTLSDQQNAFANLLAHPSSRTAFEANGTAFLSRATTPGSDVNFFARPGVPNAQEVVRGYISGSPVSGEITASPAESSPGRGQPRFNAAAPSGDVIG